MTFVQSDRAPKDRMEHYVHCAVCSIQDYTVGWSDFIFLWNFEKKQGGSEILLKKHVFI